MINFYKQAIKIISVFALVSLAYFLPAQTIPAFEAEPNGTTATATPITANPAKIRGYIYTNGDEDFYSFTATAGDRVYVAVQTSISSSSNTDSYLELYATDGTTIIEADDNDGVLGGNSSSIAGATVPSTGTYYIRVRNASNLHLRPYDLYLQVQSGSPASETESNDIAASANALPASGWISGSRGTTTDLDFFSISLNAGESVFISLDCDPERDASTWNGRVGFGLFGNNTNQVLIVNDANTTSPNSEAFFMTAKDAGTYYVYVDAATAITGPSYHLSVSKFAATSGYVNYASAAIPVTIPTGPAVVTSTITIPDNKIIKDLAVRINIDHTFMADLDVILTSPNGNNIHLFTDIGNATVGGTETTMDAFFDDYNAVPPLFTTMKGMGWQTELNSFLDNFKGMNTAGTWTLTIYDDASGDGGSLNNWSLDVLEDVTASSGFVPLFSEDFETTDGGFTHSGVADEWAWGTPATNSTSTTNPVAAVQAANSGTNCWKTDLTGTYEASSAQVLESPNIDLSAYSGSIYLRWAMKHQMESASFDGLAATVEEVGGGGLIKDVYIWYGGTQTAAVGNPVTNIGCSTGWGVRTADISAFAGKVVRFKVYLTSDNTINFAGVAIDDVQVLAPCPAITLSPAFLPNATAGTSYSQTVTQTGGAGTGAYSVTSGSLPAGLSLSTAGDITGTPTVSGAFSFDVTFADDNGCEGIASYTLIVDCPLPNTTLSVTPDLICNYNVAVTLGGGLPSGGVYSGTGVSNGDFDPSAGTQTITYTYTDQYGCVSSATDVIAVNQPPAVDLGNWYTQCPGTITLDAGFPGSTYAWSDGTTTTQTFNVPSSGTYSVTVTDVNGCTGSAETNISYFTPPVVDLGGPYVQCDGTVQLDAGNLGSFYTWSTGSNAQTLIVNLTGSYSVTVQDGNGCTGSDTADVTINISPTVDLGGPYNQCQGTVNLDAGNLGSTYLWSTGATSQTITVGTGSYAVTVTAPNTCTAEDATSVIINLPPLNSSGYTICQYDAVPAGAGLTANGCGDVTTGFSGQTSLQDPTFQRSGTGNSYNPSGIGTAVHYATHALSVGTTGSYTFSVCGYNTYLHLYQNSFNDAIPAANFLVADDDANSGTCAGGSLITLNLTAGVNYVLVVTGFGNNDVGSYTVSASGVGPVYDGPVSTVYWYDVPQGGGLVATGNLFNPVGTTTLPNTNTAGTFTFYAACPNTPDCRTPVNFVINPAPVVNLGGPYNQCGGTVTLDAANAGSTYSWSDLATTQTTLVSTSGTYGVTVANQFNCTASGNTEVYIQPVPVVNLGPDVTQCEGTVILDAGSPGNIYQWSDQSTSQTLAVSASNNYSVTVTDVNSGCTVSDDVNVTINPAPVVFLGGDIEQCGGSAILDAGNVGSTYLWSTNETAISITVNTTGIYRVTVTNNNGCTGADDISVAINPVPDLGADVTDSVCPGYTVNLNQYYANTYASYVWDIQTPTTAGAGTYTLIVNTSAGCADTAIATIINRQQPDLGADLVDSICIGYTYDLWTLYPPSASYATYVWNTPTPQEVVAGSYTLIVSNQSGCSDTLTANITYRQQPNLGEDKFDSVCIGYTVDLTTYYPNNGYETYTWDTQTPNSVGAGVYTLIVSYASGCYDTAVMTITNRQQPVVTLNMKSEMCYTEPAFELTGGMPAGGVYNVGDSLDVDTFNAVLFGIGTHHITYIYTNASGCTDSASIDFTVHPQPQITTLKAPDLCTGSDAIDLDDYVSPTGGVYSGVGVSQHFYYPSLAGAGDDTITYLYTDIYGCMDTAEYPISVKQSVSVSIASSEVDYTICRGDSITFTATGAEFYQFFINGIAVDTASLNNTFTTTSLNSHDAVFVVGSNSCSIDTSESIIIDVITNPVVDAGPDTTITLGEVVVLNPTASGASSLLYLWSPNYHLSFTNVPNPTYSGPDTTVFTLKVTDTYGCWASDSVTINVFVLENILLPNILTPNGDSKNDLWILNPKIQLEGSNLVIFNRWGEIVFEADSYTNNWDGTYKATGKKLPDGTYYYVLKVPLQNNHVYRGAINILNSDAK